MADGEGEAAAREQTGQLGTGGGRLYRRGVRLLVDVHGPAGREVDEDRVVAQRGADPAVAAGAHGDLEAARPGQADGGDDVVVGRGLHDRVGVAARLERVPEHVLAELLVGSVVPPDDGSFEVVGHGTVPFSRGRTGSRHPGGGGMGRRPCRSSA